ncbi:MAG: asparagine synthase (glutamine-hydrolyzing) [Pseudomonadota bacterium]
MCGIAGIVDLRGDRPIDPRALRRMADALVHRGPDGAGFYCEDGVGLAHRRLAVIDPAGGAQPFTTESGDVLVFNGEIYNFRELAASLTAQGARLRTRSDTEVLAEGLSRRGADFLNEVRGVFALAFWRKRTRQLMLARDRLGEKPLYYAQAPDGLFVFASEIGALQQAGLTETRLRAEAVADYFFYGYTPDPKTIYADIYKLPPAHLMTLAPQQPPTFSRYWRPCFEQSAALSFDEARDALSARLNDAVTGQLIADAPVGAFLSCGVDSAGVVSAIATTRDGIDAFTAGFDNPNHDERAEARVVAQKFGARHHERNISLDIDRLIDPVARAFGEPFADSSAIAVYALSQFARETVKAALSGDGGDEVFAGYRRYRHHLAQEAVRRSLPASAREPFFNATAALYPKLDYAPRILRAKTTLQALSLSSTEAYAASVAITLPAIADALLSDEARTELGDYRSHSVIETAFADAGANDPLCQAQYADYMTWLPGRMLVKLDRASMAHGLEVRAPLLDPNLVEWANALPPSFKLAGGVGKRVLKAALAQRLGETYVSRRKKGFALPLDAAFRDKGGALSDRLLVSSHWRESGWIDARQVERLLTRHQAGRANHAQELWTVVMFDAFLKAQAAQSLPATSSNTAAYRDAMASSA